MFRLSGAALAAFVSVALPPGRALAADAPLVGPEPAWVSPAAVNFVVPKVAGDAGVHTILQDTQINFAPGGDETYVHTVVRLDSPQALAAAGTIVIPWRPGSDTVTIHTLAVHRGDHTTNILEKQHFTILRRENNLEAAMLDGQLTATLQVEDLQLGDVIDMALTMKSVDPVMKGLSETAGLTPAAGADRFRLRALWPGTKPIRWRFGPAYPPAKKNSAADKSELLIDMRDAQPWRPPTGAPVRYQLGTLFEFSEFQSWAEISRLFAPLYVQARSVTAQSPLKAEAAKIRAASSDPKAQALAALALVQDRVRYVALEIGEGNLTPASADQTWERRFGDCKGKTALLLALLDQLGIAAEPALVNSALGDGLDARLPRVTAFDHVLVKAMIAGETYWLDGADIADTRLAALRAAPYEWALPLTAKGSDLVRLTEPPLDQPNSEDLLALDARAGFDKPAPAHAESVLRGRVAKLMKVAFANTSANDRDRLLRQYWSEKYDFFTPTTISERFDAATGEERIVADGMAAMDWQAIPGFTSRRYEIDGSVVGWDLNLTRQPGEDAGAPYAIAHPLFNFTRETIALPNRGAGFVVEGNDVSTTLGGEVLSRTSKIADGVFTMTASQRSLASEFSAAEAPAVTKAMRDLSRNAVYLRSPGQAQPPAGSTAGPADRLSRGPNSGPASTASELARAGQRLSERDWVGARGVLLNLLERERVTAKPDDLVEQQYMARTLLDLGVATLAQRNPWIGTAYLQESLARFRTILAAHPADATANEGVWMAMGILAAVPDTGTTWADVVSTMDALQRDGLLSINGARAAEIAHQKADLAAETAAAAQKDAAASRTSSGLPKWRRKPDGALFSRYYPAQALKNNIDGRVVLTCKIRPTDDLDCRVKSEEPRDQGFGEAALKMSKAFLVERGSGFRAGGTVNIPISFKASDKTGSPPAAQISEDVLASVRSAALAAPNDLALQQHYILALITHGCDLADSDDERGAIEAYNEALTRARALLAQNPGRSDLRRYVWAPLSHLVEMKNGGLDRDALVKEMSAAPVADLSPIDKVRLDHAKQLLEVVTAIEGG